MTVTAAWNALTGLTRQAIRLSTVRMTPTGSLTVRSGVIPGGTPLLLTGSVMTGSIAPGRAVVQGTSAQGAYPVVVDAATPITVANGHASLSRIDTVFLVVLDTDIDASGSRQAQIVYTQGTAGSGSAPTAPASGLAYLRLWDILVPAGASSGSPINWLTALTDQRVYTVSVGGITPGAAAGSYAGQWRDAAGATGILERWNGSSWEAAVRLGNSGSLQLGDVALTRSAAGIMQVGGGLVVTGVGQLQSAYATADQQATSTTVLANSTYLLLPVVANATYLLDGYIEYEGAGSGAGDLKADWTIPASATMRWAPWSATPGVNANALDTLSKAAGTTYALGAFGAGVAVAANIRGRLVTLGTAGNLQLQFAQQAASATPTKIRLGSWIRLHRIA